jgi:hypothetical protein
VFVAVMVTAAIAQEVSVSSIINLPAIWGTELISSAGPTVLLVKVWTPFDDARYRIKWTIFNEKGVKVRHGDSGWFWWKNGSNLTFETPVEPSLKGNGYYVKTNLQYAVFVEN